jgi:MFS family permease
VLAPYRTALATPGAIRFTLAGVLGRLPMATLGLGIVLLVVSQTGSYGLAGSVSAASLLAESAAAPVLGRVIDRIGQRRLLIPAVLGFTVSVLLLVVAVEQQWPPVLLHVIAAATGAFFPPIGACVRARWSYTLGSGQTLQTAFALESVNDEVVFIAGPVLVTVLATQVHETAGLLVVLVLTGCGILWLAYQRSTEPPPQAVGHEAAEPLPKLWLGAMVAAAACLGSLFGSAEVITVAFADEHGRAGLTGLLLAGWAFGSLLAGIITGAVTWKVTPLRRYRLGTVALVAVMVPFPFIDNLAVLAVWLFIAGFAVSPTFVAVFSLIESTVPATRLTEGITWLSTGIALGVAPGAAISGRIIDDSGASTAFVVPIVAGVVGAVIAWSTGPRDTPSSPVLAEE